MRHELIFHLHTPKTAGSSVRSKLIESGWILANGFNKNSIQNHEGNLISGHFMFGAFPLFRFRKNVTQVTVLRDPMELMVSMYGFVKDRPKHPFHCLAVEGFNWFWRGRMFKNIQARYLAGRLASTLYSYRIISDNLLYKIAAKNLQKIDFVGTQGDLHNLFMKMKRNGLFDKESTSFGYINVGQDQNRVSFEYLEEFKYFNRIDYQIYHLACEMGNNSC